MVPTVIIVNYRTPQLTIDCLQSLVSEICFDRGDRVIVVDGNSQDGSVATIQSAINNNAWSVWASLIPLDQNRGFAYANNTAMRAALESDAPPDCFWLLNPDTIVKAGTLYLLLTFLQTHPQAGIVGGGIEDPFGTPEHSSFRFPSFWSEVDLHLRWGVVTRLLGRRTVAPPIREDVHQTEWVSGANAMIRRELLDDTGLMDDKFFLYYEETDLCRRAADAGWECWNVPEGRVTHFGGASTCILHDHREERRRPDYWFASRRRYFLKHYGRVYAAATDIVSVLSLMIWKLRRVIQRKPVTDPPRYLFDLCRHAASMEALRQ